MIVDITLPVDSLMEILRRESPALFHLRKAGITLGVPAVLRDQVVTLYTDEARRLFRQIDGDVKRHDAPRAAAAEPLELAMALLRQDASALFQLRKVAVSLSVPPAFRGRLVNRYGDAAVLLRLVDGDVQL